MRALSEASRRDVLVAWDGLGYNRRAVALSEAARIVEHEHGGRMPRDMAALQRLPGVGPYTAAAVASIAFGAPIAAIDTNVRRIVARVFVGDASGAIAPSRVRELSETWLERDDPGGWNQALMDMGRRCRPRRGATFARSSERAPVRVHGRDAGSAGRRQSAFEARSVRCAAGRAGASHTAFVDARRAR
jgi:A/G-specific adenine glycosylase